MDNILNGGIEELEQVKSAIIDDARKAHDLETAEGLLRKSEKELENLKKKLADEREAAVKAQRSEIERQYDGKVQEAKKNLRTAQKARNDAKTAAVNERINTATAALVAENGQLNAQINALLKQWKLPRFMNTRYYCAMYFTRKPADFLIFLITVLVCVALIPNVVCALLGSTVGTAGKILIYIAIVAFFIVLYFIVLVWTKSGAKGKVMEKIRPTRAKIRKNKKEIKKLSGKITRDKDESSYNLSGHDSEIRRRKHLADIAEAEKNTALFNFDQNTAPQIRAQIDAKLKPHISELSAQTEALTTDCNRKKQLSAEASDILTKNYIPYLSKKNMSPEKIDELIAIINEGKAENIYQALAVQNGIDVSGDREQ